MKHWAYVYYRFPGLEEWAWKYSKGDGSFLLPEIPEGPVEIRAVRPGSGKEVDDVEGVTVDAGAKDVVVPVR